MAHRSHPIAGVATAQSAIRIESPPEGRLGWLTHPYRPRSVPPINLSNSSRLESLVRAGNLYLTAQDVVALESGWEAEGLRRLEGAGERARVLGRVVPAQEAARWKPRDYARAACETFQLLAPLYRLK